MGAGAVQLLDEGGVGVLVGVQEGTLAVTKVGFVHLRCDDEVPAELDEVDDERVPAAAGLHVVVGADVAPAVATGSTPSALLRVDLQQRCLWIGRGSACWYVDREGISILVRG